MEFYMEAAFRALSTNCVRDFRKYCCCYFLVLLLLLPTATGHSLLYWLLLLDVRLDKSGLLLLLATLLSATPL